MELPAMCPRITEWGEDAAVRALYGGCWIFNCVEKATARTGLCKDHVEELRHETNK